MPQFRAGERLSARKLNDLADAAGAGLVAGPGLALIPSARGVAITLEERPDRERVRAIVTRVYGVDGDSVETIRYDAEAVGEPQAVMVNAAPAYGRIFADGAKTRPAAVGDRCYIIRQRDAAGVVTEKLEILSEQYYARRCSPPGGNGGGGGGGGGDGGGGDGGDPPAPPPPKVPGATQRAPGALPDEPSPQPPGPPGPGLPTPFGGNAPREPRTRRRSIFDFFIPRPEPPPPVPPPPPERHPRSIPGADDSRPPPQPPEPPAPDADRPIKDPDAGDESPPPPPPPPLPPAPDRTDQAPKDNEMLQARPVREEFDLDLGVWGSRAFIPMPGGQGITVTAASAGSAAWAAGTYVLVEYDAPGGPLPFSPPKTIAAPGGKISIDASELRGVELLCIRHDGSTIAGARARVRVVGENEQAGFAVLSRPGDGAGPAQGKGQSPTNFAAPSAEA